MIEMNEIYNVTSHLYSILLVNSFIVNESQWGISQLCERGTREHPVTRFSGRSRSCSTCPGLLKAVEKRVSSVFEHHHIK